MLSDDDIANLSKVVDFFMLEDMFAEVINESYRIAGQEVLNLFQNSFCYQVGNDLKEALQANKKPSDPTDCGNEVERSEDKQEQTADGNRSLSLVEAGGPDAADDDNPAGSEDKQDVKV